MIHRAKHLSVSINKPVVEVYDFASNPKNLPKWAAGLSSGIIKNDEEWILESPMGEVKVKFTEKNKYGILDHDVTLPSGEVVHNPMRIQRNGNGSEVIFTLYRLPNMSDEGFAADAAQVEKDLNKLKALMEK